MALTLTPTPSHGWQFDDFFHLVKKDRSFKIPVCQCSTTTYLPYIMAFSGVLSDISTPAAVRCLHSLLCSPAPLQSSLLTLTHHQPQASLLFASVACLAACAGLLLSGSGFFNTKLSQSTTHCLAPSLCVTKFTYNN